STYSLPTLRHRPPSSFSYDPAHTQIYTLSLHDALPISRGSPGAGGGGDRPRGRGARRGDETRPAAGRPSRSGAETGRPASCRARDRKSTRLNSSHVAISYAVFCLKKKRNSEVLRCRADL